MKMHGIMIAMPMQGHLTPFVHLAIKLALKGITITFVHTEYVHHQISKSNTTCEDDIFSEARNSGLDIRYATISDGFPLEFDRDVNLVEYWEAMLHDFPVVVDRFLGRIIEAEEEEESSVFEFLVADTFASWPGMVAEKYNLVNVSFWTQPAMAFAINYYTDLLRLNGHYPPKDNDEYIINYIPGVDSISSKDLMSHLQETETTIVHDIIFKAFADVVNADFFLHNTMQELESHTLSILNQQMPTYTIGPINFQTETNVSKSMLSETDCSNWLDSKPPGSVLYVSFGSIVQTDRQVIQEIAQGLLLSQVNFIWAIRPKIVDSVEDTSDVLPLGFENDVEGRGLVVPWCNQFDVLSHPAVGGFLTHCGWNSVLEGIWCGVPMICYPVLYDQPTNRKLVVDDWRIGVNLCDGVSVNRDEIARKINKIMDISSAGETSDGIRNEMKKFRSIMHDAVVEDGSSKTNFDHFFKDLVVKIQTKRDGTAQGTG